MGMWVILKKKKTSCRYTCTKKKFMYMTTGEKIHACSMSQKSMLHGVKIMHTHIPRRTYPNHPPKWKTLPPKSPPLRIIFGNYRKIVPYSKPRQYLKLNMNCRYWSVYWLSAISHLTKDYTVRHLHTCILTCIQPNVIRLWESWNSNSSSSLKVVQESEVEVCFGISRWVMQNILFCW